MSIQIESIGGELYANGVKMGIAPSFARIVDSKPLNTGGGFNIVGTQDRDLNTIEHDTEGIVSLANDEFTLQAGKYIITYGAPAHRTKRHNCHLWSVTDSGVASQGTCHYASDLNSVDAPRSVGTYYVVLSASHTYKIRHYTERLLGANTALGVANTLGECIYTTVDIQRIG